MSEFLSLRKVLATAQKSHHHLRGRQGAGFRTVLSLFFPGGHWSPRTGGLDCSYSRWGGGEPWLLRWHVSHPLWCSAQTCHFLQWIQWFDVQNAVSIWWPCQCGEGTHSADRSFPGNLFILQVFIEFLTFCRHIWNVLCAQRIQGKVQPIQKFTF